VNKELTRLNPDLPLETAVYGYDVIRNYKLLGVSAASEGKIGQITDSRMKAFIDEMVKAGALPESDSYQKAYTLQFMDAL
jgi:hypothetical protein